MDPATMMLLASLITGGASVYSASQNGKEGEQKSSYSPQAQQGLEDALKVLQQLKTGADVRQNQGYGQGMEFFNSLFNDPEFFRKFEAPAKRQYEEEIIPGLANRFASEGSGGSLGSTGFRNQLAREGSNLETNLAAMRGGMQQQAIPQMYQYAQGPAQNYQSLLSGSTQPTQNIYQPPTAGGAANMWAGMSSALMQGYGNNAYGNPNAGQSPSTNAMSGAYNYPLTGMYDQQFRNGGVY